MSKSQLFHDYIYSSNVKKHFNTYVDFLDYNWIKYFEKEKLQFYIIPNSKEIFLKFQKK